MRRRFLNPLHQIQQRLSQLPGRLHVQIYTDLKSETRFRVATLPTGPLSIFRAATARKRYHDFAQPELVFYEIEGRARASV
jgi:hypothetical protein